MYLPALWVYRKRRKQVRDYTSGHSNLANVRRQHKCRRSMIAIHADVSFAGSLDSPRQPCDLTGRLLNSFSYGRASVPDMAISRNVMNTYTDGNVPLAAA